MMEGRMRFVVPVLLIVIGVAWLLQVMQVIPSVDWIWTAALAATGAMTLIVGGINKLTVVLGPFLVGAAACSLLRQTGRLNVDKEVPILLILLGCLMLLAQLMSIPTPDILKKEQGKV